MTSNNITEINTMVAAFSKDARELVGKYGSLRNHLLEIKALSNNLQKDFDDAANLLHDFVIDILPVGEEPDIESYYKDKDLN